MFVAEGEKVPDDRILCVLIYVCHLWFRSWCFSTRYQWLPTSLRRISLWKAQHVKLITVVIYEICIHSFGSWMLLHVAALMWLQVALLSENSNWTTSPAGFSKDWSVMNRKLFHFWSSSFGGGSVCQPRLTSASVNGDYISLWPGNRNRLLHSIITLLKIATEGFLNFCQNFSLSTFFSCSDSEAHMVHPVGWRWVFRLRWLQEVASG